jgi:predicted DsbA family dithiol-disulfide isomerase
MPDQTQTPLRIDIVSDVMCPWCIVGYQQLEQALEKTGIAFEIEWHPFELNPDMPPQGQDLVEHIGEKYGSTPEQSAANRAHLSKLGMDLGFTFNFRSDARIYNTFLAHQLLHWAGIQGRKHDLKMEMFTTHFTHGRDMASIDVLADCAAAIGLDRQTAVAVLTDGRFTDDVRAELNLWKQRGISSVPSTIFNQRHLVSGAQGADAFVQILEQLTASVE